MAGHPLRSATDRRLGRPLPRQLANQTRVHLTPPEFFTLFHAELCAYAVLAVISNCYPPVQGRLPTRYSPVRHSVTKIFIPKKSNKSASFDLHVLSTPPAFILSQDQTLMFKFVRSKSVWLILPFLLLFGSFEPFLKIFSYKKFSRVVVYCSVIKVLTSLCSFATAHLFYHKHFALSRTF